MKISWMAIGRKTFSVLNLNFDLPKGFFFDYDGKEKRVCHGNKDSGKYSC